MQKELRRENRLRLHFLACTLEWRAVQRRMRSNHIRQQLKMPLAWGATHSHLADVAMAIVAQAKHSLGEPDSEVLMVDEDYVKAQ